MSLGLSKYILPDVKVEVMAISTPPPYKESDQFYTYNNFWTESDISDFRQASVKARNIES